MLRSGVEHYQDIGSVWKVTIAGARIVMAVNVVEYLSTGAATLNF